MITTFFICDKNMSKKKNENSDDINEEEIEPVKRFENDKNIEKQFPHLFSELKSDSHFKTGIKINKDMISVNKVEKVIDSPEEKIEVVITEDIEDPLKTFDPTAVDFIRRAKTKEEAEEIIEFLAKRNEITEEKKIFLLNKLTNEGLSSFGKHKKLGYYFDYVDKKREEAKFKATKSIFKKPEEKK